jgi:hypothetical protein
MGGILKLADKLLVNDRAKFVMLLVAISFSVFLMIMMLSMFAGVLNRASSTVINIGAKMDPAVNNVANTIGLPDYTLDAVRIYSTHIRLLFAILFPCLIPTPTCRESIEKWCTSVPASLRGYGWQRRCLKKDDGEVTCHCSYFFGGSASVYERVYI